MRLLSYLGRTGKKLPRRGCRASTLHFISGNKNFCADEKKLKVIENIIKLLKTKYPAAEIIDDERVGDGVRVELDNEMFVVRLFTKWTYLTIKYEAKTKESYEVLRKSILELLQNFCRNRLEITK